MILGVDVYSGYGRIDWVRARAAGVRFAILKCTQGNDGKDSRFDENAEGCRNAGVHAAPYLFGYPLPIEAKYHPGRHPAEQAQRLFQDCKGLGTQDGDLPPVLDIEWPPHFEKEKGTSKIINRWTQWNVTADYIAAWSLACLAELERLFKRTPIVYTYPHFWQSLGAAGKTAAFAKYPLWIANYTHLTDWMPPPDATPIVPAPWSDWTLWQFSADGSPISIPGIPACPLDRNVCRDLGTLLQLPRDKTYPTTDGAFEALNPTGPKRPAA
jgi:lysozyme